jgi:16S rRNA (guanine966-N2)-methyltransferase
LLVVADGSASPLPRALPPAATTLCAAIAMSRTGSGAAAMHPGQRPDRGERVKLTGGRARGRRLRRPRIEGLRPTSARLRGALFDVLGSRIHGASFLDVFAGTGAIGLDALSRGAARAVFIESDRRAARAIADNLALAGVAGSARIIEGDAEASLLDLRRSGERFDIVFLDPPYAAESLDRALPAAAGLLRSGGVIVVEHASRRGFDTTALPGLRRGRRYVHGDSALSVLHDDGSPAPT